MSDINKEEFLSRATACILACNGMTLEEINELSEFGGVMRLVVSADDYLQQRDDLANALKAAMTDQPGWYDLARQALSKVHNK